MRQQVDFTVCLTYDADASLDRAALIAAIVADINRLADVESGSPVELCRYSFATLKEEAEIYGNA